MMLRANRCVAWLPALLLALASAACAPAAAPATPGAERPAGASTPITAAPTAVQAAATPTAAPAAAAPQTFRWAGQSPATDAGLYVAMDRGYFAEQGLQLDYVTFQSASDMVPALATRQVEGGGLSVNAATINAAARGIEIKAVADKGSLLPGFSWEVFLIRKDLADSGRFRGAADLKGLVFATTPPVNAGAGYPALDRLLSQAGLTQADLRLEALGFAELNAALAGQSIDVAIQLEPLATAAVEQGIATRWLGLDEIYPNQQVAVIGYGPAVTTDNPALGRAFMVAYLKGVRDYYRAFTTGAGKADVAAIIAKHSTVRDPALVERMAPAGLNPDGHVNLEALIEDQRFYVEKGVVPTPVDMYQLVDHSYVDAALRILGPYRTP